MLSDLPVVASVFRRAKNYLDAKDFPATIDFAFTKL